MSKLKMMIVPALALASFATAMPVAASAQPMPRGPAHASAQSLNSFVERKIELERRVDRAAAQRRLTAREARDFKRELAAIERQARASMRNGLSRQERQALDRQLDRFEQKLERESRPQFRPQPGRR
ncbi:hypothetical protein [uncultured Brevundimonas sp.]|uniref:hypothetical protein n=1 Tax=uncultured Brevundimonas sp. TaxID=213418 RepID=UPI00262B9B8A|nr:hypothetical protein [uncultured Brevundimonas sp.]